MIPRIEYLRKLASFKDKDVIKVATGIRRCGKSTLFEQFIAYLKNTGVTSEQIIHIKLTDGEHDFITNHQELYAFVNRQLSPTQQNYVFLDEVQEVTGFEKAVNALYEKPNIDMYITGSNSKLLSGELATYLTGRYVEIKMLPLSFKEYTSVKGASDLRRKYNDYIANSSFPATIDLANTSDVRLYLEGLYGSIVLKDIVERYKISDATSLNLLTRFMYDNIGNAFSANNISTSLAASGRTISVPTVDNYVNALKGAYMLYEARRYDVKGKDFLKAPTKYYIPDIGLRYFLLGSKPTNAGSILENVVYLELLRRDYEVSVGKVGDKEVDFIAVDQNQEPTYIQVSYSVENPDTLTRELSSLQAISDNFPKLLLTLDDVLPISHGGIQQLNALDWLLQG